MVVLAVSVSVWTGAVQALSLRVSEALLSSRTFV